MLAPQAVVYVPSAQRFSNEKARWLPGQDDVGRHVADNARIVPVVAREARIGGVAVGDQRRAKLHIGAHERLDRFGRVVGDHGQAQPARTGVCRDTSRPCASASAFRRRGRSPRRRRRPGFCRRSRARRTRRRRGRESPSDPPRRRLEEDRSRDRPSTTEATPARRRRSHLVGGAPVVLPIVAADLQLECWRGQVGRRGPASSKRT